MTDHQHRLSHHFRVGSGEGFQLNQIDPGSTDHARVSDKQAAQVALADGVERMAALQDKLYAQDRWALLLVFQAMDAAGKDGTIKHVMSGVNPQGCQVSSFKAPSAIDLDHDYLWRANQCLPERGRIGIFNRSYYEETLVVRVHREILEKQKIPRSLLTGDLWAQRHEDIRSFERYLSRNGVLVRKFFLNISKKEQKKRFLERIDTPDKNWKFSAADVRERGRWDEYMSAYEETIRATATTEAPWYVIPADHKWFSRLVVAAAVIDAMAGLDLAYPTVTSGQREELAEARAALEAEG